MNDPIEPTRLAEAALDATGTTPFFCRSSRLRDTRITLSHGSGGKAMRDLIEDVFVSCFDNPALAPLEDQARFALSGLLAHGDRLAFTTDSYVVDPLFFPGGDIGTLAVNGTVNDLAVSGARPLYLSCGVILEEGLNIDTLRRVARSMASAAAAAGVAIVTGDTKVVHRGAADKLFINTAGIGVIPQGTNINSRRAQPGDIVLVNGTIGDHGAAILAVRQDLALDTSIESDCQPLNSLIAAMLAACPDIHCLRDATRGGVATVLKEIAESASVCIRFEESRLPVREQVKGVCEILGLDPLYMANEGKLVAVVPRGSADAVLAAMRNHPAGRDAAMLGEVIAAPQGTVLLVTLFGGERIVDMLVGEQLPRIC
ncbi:hydrogenase expression/formation protein HypE [Glaciimonas sp. PCH181]|uniref:hydrogenase expression/formation protein HypE n=1 Tax=Glaciimonas sp. PCH181 TaxID=2133943 RepID=UPI000D3501D7|nr:hydrogenase expression/formation protein HypE [Glaciimonas sp. PCH181]PUA18924.1 hydrogenase expression/formation protein HypE [Glaciimonas sp. PCH181]